VPIDLIGAHANASRIARILLTSDRLRERIHIRSGGHMAGFRSLEDLLHDELKDIYDAERQLTKALPKMVKKSTAPALKEAFEDHLRETTQHVSRLERAFEALGLPARGKKCVGMQNLLKEGDEMIAEAANESVRDAVIIASAQKVEHYEISSYGTARTWARLLDKDEVASLLDQTLEDEKTADGRLTEIAMGFVNQAAAEGDGDDPSEARGPQGEGQARTIRGSGRGPRYQAADRNRGSMRGRKRR
jgi:ferritin-like metal-binding protein YciE